MKPFLFFVFLLVIVSSIQAQPAEKIRPSVEADLQKLTLEKAVNLALQNNLAIEAEKYNPEITGTFVTLEKSRFEPLLTANLLGTDADEPTGSVLVGEGIVSYRTYDYNFIFRQLLKTGTTYDVTFNNSRVETNQLFSAFDPRYDSSLFFNASQPLLRNFGLEITKMPLQIAEKNLVISDYRLKQRMQDIALQVEQTYWTLVFARDELDVKKKSLEAASDLYENNKKQVDVGTMAPLEIVVAEAEVAAREEEIIVVESLIRNTEDRLKSLVLGTGEETQLQIVPVDEPVIREIDFTEEEAIQRALNDNPDLKALETDLQSKTLSTRLAHNALKPQLDLTASAGFTGLGGERLLLTDGFPPSVIGTVPGGYGDALDTMFDNPTFRVGFVVGLPIGNKAARADYVRADLTQKQAQVLLEDTKQQLLLNIRLSIQNLKRDIKVLAAARASRVLQEKKLDAEVKKLNVGLSTNHVVLEFQDDLEQARSRELLAIVDYNREAAQLKRYVGIILPK